VLRVPDGDGFQRDLLHCRAQTTFLSAPFSFKDWIAQLFINADSAAFTVERCTAITRTTADELDGANGSSFTGGCIQSRSWSFVNITHFPYAPWIIARSRGVGVGPKQLLPLGNTVSSLPVYA